MTNFNKEVANMTQERNWSTEWTDECIKQYNAFIRLAERNPETQFTLEESELEYLLDTGKYFSASDDEDNFYVINPEKNRIKKLSF